MPANLLVLCLLLRVNRHLHAVVEHRISLVVIQDIKLDWHSTCCVGDSEVEPLGVSLSVDVVLHEAVVLLVTDFGGEVQIATFEARFEEQCLVVWTTFTIVASLVAQSHEPLWSLTLRLLALGSVESFVQLFVHPRAYLIFSDKLLYIEEVLVLKDVTLRQLSDLFVEVFQNLRVSQIDNVLNQPTLLD